MTVRRAGARLDRSMRAIGPAASPCKHGHPAQNNRLRPPSWAHHQRLHNGAGKGSHVHATIIGLQSH